MSFVGPLKRVDATMRGSSVKDFNLTGTFGPSSGLVAFTGRKLPIVLLPYEDCHLPNLIGPRQSTTRSRFRPRVRRGWLHPGRRRPLHRLSEHREGGAECRRGESGRRTLSLRE
jgi:hypothetical protein